ncbi:MAG: GAF domain-containing protein, partial [Deltaproteobacteria bacterium]|nr:GAF domain-containing protein [Deltaproteobacteria bacterium]
MAGERTAFLNQMVEVFTSTVSFGERLNNMVHLLGRNLKVELALYFALDKAKETLFLNISSQGPVPPHLRVEFPVGQGVVGETAVTRKIKVIHRNHRPVLPVDAPLAKLHPAYQTLASFPVADDNFLYGVLLLMDREDRSITHAERQSVQLACLMLAGTLRQAILQDEAKKRIAELSVLFEVGKALSSTVELEVLLERIVSTTAKVITARGASLQIVDAVTGEVRVSSRYGRIPPEGPFPPPDFPGPGGPGTAPHFEAQAADSQGHTHYCLAVPLIFKGQLRGALCVYDKFALNGDYLPFDPENRQLLYTMAGLIVSAIENALTYQQVEELAEKNQRMVKNLTALQEISQALLTTVQTDKILGIILQGLTLEHGLGFDRAMVMLVDEADQTLKGARAAQRTPLLQDLPLREGLLLPLSQEIPVAAWEIPLQAQGPMITAALHKRPYHHHTGQVQELSPELRKYYSPPEFSMVPLVVKDRVTGVILVDNEA